VRQICDLSSGKIKSTTIYEDNSAYIAQLKERYIKGNKRKHILSRFFFTHDLQRDGDEEIQKICLCKTLADLFTKYLSMRTSEQLVGFCHLLMM